VMTLSVTPAESASSSRLLRTVTQAPCTRSPAGQHGRSRRHPEFSAAEAFEKLQGKLINSLQDKLAAAGHA